MKKVISLAIAATMVAAALSGCGESSNSGSASGSANTQAAGGASGAISVVTREDGSGTRSAFIELFGVEAENEAGEKVDNTIQTAEVTNSTSVMMTTVAGNTAAIGYVSLGYLDEKSVSAVKIDGVEPSADNVKNDTYKIKRPFNIATKDGLSDVAADFIKFIMSEQGQAVVEENGYISQGNEGAYTASSMSGKITIAGSSSVTPVMEKLSEAYRALNSGVTIEVQQSDSTTGMTSAIDGTCDIGMASRDLKDSELSAGLKNTVIALDGIAVIVNKNSSITGSAARMPQTHSTPTSCPFIWERKTDSG